MSCAEAPSPSRLTSNTPEDVCSTSGTLASAPVPAEGWTAEAEGLVGSDARGGVVSEAVVASTPADRVLAMRSWILPRGGRQTVGEIGPKGGRRHDSLLMVLPSSEGDKAEGPHGDERNALLLYFYLR
jgi:hypothetical protein